MWQFLWLTDAHFSGNIWGFWLSFAGIIFMIMVIGFLSRIMYSPENGEKGYPIDHDNRWPGYPLRVGDPGYDPLTKGVMGNLPALVLVKDPMTQQPEWVSEAYYNLTKAS